MYDAIHFGTAVYRNELTRRLHALGYETERATKGFEIKGVSPEVREKFSTRSTQAKAIVADMERKLGRKLSNNQISHVIHQSRPEKVTGISQSEVRQQQVSQLSTEERRQLNAVRQSATGPPATIENPVNEQQAIAYATEHIFERASVAPEYKLLHAALQHGRGQVDLTVLKEQIRSSPHFVPVAGELSTREILQTELFLINAVDQGKDSRAPIDPRYVPQDHALGVDQRNAVSFILRSRDQITGLRGLAGTGKSRTLKELLHAFQEAGCRTVACAPTGAATENLRRDGLPAITLQRLLVNSTLQSDLTRQSIIVVDEAGMVSTDDMRKLFTLATEKQARVVLCGDTGQHTAVTRGDALRILEKYSRYAYAELTKNWRQKSAPEYQRAVRKAAQRQSREAFELLEKMGAVVETSNVHEQAAAAYIESTSTGKTALLVSPTWHEIELVTPQVRAKLKQRGLVEDKEHSMTVYDSLSWTTAEKKNLRNYVAGQVLVFHRKSGAYAAHEALTVVGVERNGLSVRRENGREALFQPGSGKTFDVCESKTLPVARGDKLLLQARHKAGGLEFVNGEIVQVEAVKAGEIHLSDGRRLPRNYRSFTHGYAVTSHAAQSQTVQEVVVVASSSSLPAIHGREFYVDVSRGKERCRVFTDDRELLRRKIGDPKERKAAIELAVLEQAMIKAGLIQPARQDHSTSDQRDTLRLRQFRGITIGTRHPDRQLAAILRHLHALAQRVQTRLRRQISTGVRI